MYKIKRGLTLPISGAPSQTVDEKQVRHVAITGPDYVGMKPTMLVKVGDRVQLGDPLFACKKNVGVVYTAPGTGEVAQINRGEKRVLESVVIKLDGSEERQFEKFGADTLNSLDKEKVRNQLLQSGLWTAIRRRPYSTVANPFEKPSSIFVTGIDTHPLASNPEIVIAKYAEDYFNGIRVLTNLTESWVHNIVHKNFSLDIPAIEKCETVRFNGKHPAGNPGTHIHFIDPVNEHKCVWHVGYQDVIAIGKLFTTGKIWTDRYVALCGPLVNNPRIIKTRLGADIDEIIEGELNEVTPRVISGSVLHGRTASHALRFLGRFNNQVTVIEEDRERKLLGWIRPGLNKHSLSRAFLSALLPKRNIAMTSTQNGSHRPIVPIGLFEEVFPFRMLPTQLGKALMVDDIENALKLGVVELDEEDVAVMTYACSGKNDYGVKLREMLTTIEKEG